MDIGRSRYGYAPVCTFSHAHRLMRVAVCMLRSMQLSVSVRVCVCSCVYVSVSAVVSAVVCQRMSVYVGGSVSE